MTVDPIPEPRFEKVEFGPPSPFCGCWQWVHFMAEKLDMRARPVDPGENPTTTCTGCGLGWVLETQP